MLKIEAFKPGVEADLWEVFYSAIHEVCIQHYSLEQVSAWAPDNVDQNIWRQKMQTIQPNIAYWDSKVVGYADLQEDGYIDHFFVHGQYQNQGVGTALMDQVLSLGSDKPLLYSHVSKTARGFYEKYNFAMVREQCIELKTVHLQNFVMEKHMP